MAKIIRCPNCGENVEIPPNPSGQVVTCIACGTALRLKGRKKGELGQGGSDAHGTSAGGSMSGSMTTIAQSPGYGQSSGSSDDPPSLGTECEVCGNTVDPSDLLEDRGRMVCRSCLKKPKATGKAPKFDNLIPFAEPDRPAPRGKLFTATPAFFGGMAALLVFAACQVFLFFNPKPVGSKVVVVAPGPDQPLPSSETAWDRENRPKIEKLMQEADALKADPAKAAEAKAKYDEILALAKGQASGSPEVAQLLNLAEQQSEALKRAPAPVPGAAEVAPTSPGQAAPAPAVPSPSDPVATAPPPAPVVVPEDVAPKPNSILDDPELAVTDLLDKGMASLETALASPGEPAIPHATEAKIKFSEARGLLNQLRRNATDDAGRVLANHGTAVAYIFLREYDLALRYLDALPPNPDRAATLNRVVVLLQTREQKMDAIRLLLKLLESDAEAKDVYAINLLGTALARYPDETIQQEEELRNAKQAYTAIAKKLAAAHPGERRWGVTWITPREYDEKLRQASRQKNQIAELEKILRVARADIERYSRSPQTAQMLATRQNDEKIALQRIAEARAGMTQEEWLTPEQILPVLPDVTAVNNATRRVATQPASAG